MRGRTDGTRARPEEVNADGTSGIPLPTTLILDGGGMVRWVDAHTDHGAQTEPVAILDGLDELNAWCRASSKAASRW